MNGANHGNINTYQGGGLIGFIEGTLNVIVENSVNSGCVSGEIVFGIAHSVASSTNVVSMGTLEFVQQSKESEDESFSKSGSEEMDENGVFVLWSECEG